MYATAKYLVAAALLVTSLTLSQPSAGVEQGAVVACRVAVVNEANRSGPGQAAEELFRNRVRKRSDVAFVPPADDGVSSQPDVTIVITKAGTGLDTAMTALAGTLPTLPGTATPHPEGFSVRLVTQEGQNYVVILGADDRALVYGVGALLRAMTYLSDRLVIPPLNLSEKPAFPIRGGSPSGPGSNAQMWSDLRPQTGDEQRETMEDLLLLGANCFHGDPDYLRDTYGVMSLFGRTLNWYSPGFPEAWAADDTHKANLVCPSVPEAHQALLASYDEMFKNAKDYDFFLTNSGDDGGCACDRCAPWGGTYIRLLHEVADLLHKYHPDTKILATNQVLTNEGNQAIVDYLNSADSSWLYALRYGPASDEMQPYIRGPVNPRWFEYEGFGPYGNYLKYLHHALPRTTNLMLYTGTTHWMKAQYEVARPDIALAAVYDRRSWNARPQAFHDIGAEIMHYAIGDIPYTEGMHDDFNKWIWARMLWNPNQSAEALTEEYCRYWFGPDAAPDMTRAIFLMEQTLERPILGNDGIEESVDVVRAAGKHIPDNLLAVDWRWRVIAAKALMDRYIQLELERGEDLKQAAARHLADADVQPRSALEAALKALDKPIETKAMKALRDEALERGEESNTIIGYREPAAFIVDKYDLTETGWWKKIIEEALATDDGATMVNAAHMILRYDDPGKGGFYDNLGWPDYAVHCVMGERKWRFRPPFGPARHSHYNMAFGYKDREAVTLAYDGLDPNAQYVLRVTVGAAFFLDGEASRDLAEGLTVDGIVLSEHIPVAAPEAAYYEFDLPRETTQDGAIRVVFTPKSEKLPATAASEAWLMVKENMPWTARP